MYQPTAPKPCPLQVPDGIRAATADVGRFERFAVAHRPLGARPVLVSLVVFSSIAFAGRADGELIITMDEPAGELQSGASGLSAPALPDGDLINTVRHFNALPHDALPSGMGASSGGSSTGLALVGVLNQTLGPPSSAVLSSSLEERRLYLPASPVFDRLQPPRAR